MASIKNSDKYVSNCENVYQAVDKIAKETRRALKTVDYDVPVSKALSCMIDGRPIENEVINKKKPDMQIQEDYFDILENVSDPYIIESVKHSVNNYRNTHQINYFYSDNILEANKSRVNILTNMIIDKLEEKQ